MFENIERCIPRTGPAPGWIENVCKTMFMGDSKTYVVCLLFFFVFVCYGTSNAL